MKLQDIYFGFQSSIYNNIPLQEELALADNTTSMGLKTFDIFFDQWAPSNITHKERDVIAKLKETIYFTVHVPICFASMQKTTVANDKNHYVFNTQQQEYLDFITWLGPKTITVHFDTLTFALLQALVDSVPKTTKVCIENTYPDYNSMYKLSYIPFMQKAIKTITNKKVYATFDTGHAKINGFNVVNYAKELLDKNIQIATLHVHDNNGIEDQHLPAGSVKPNGIDFASLFSIIKQKSNHPIYGVIEHWGDNAKALEYLIQQ